MLTRPLLFVFTYNACVPTHLKYFVINTTINQIHKESKRRWNK